MRALTIGDVAHRAGVNVETVRYYEREGLIEEPPRRPSGYRDFPEETVRRIRFIRRGKELGFSLQDLRELLALRVHPSARPEDVRARAEEKVADIDTKIGSLRSMKRSLTRLIAACEGCGDLGECPILDALEKT